MTDKEFRRLSRADLIEIIYTLQKSEGSLREENEALKQKLEDRRVIIEESGSLAEALARLNGLFEAAQATADGYRSEAQELLEEARRTREQADEYMSGVKQKAAKLASVTMQQREKLLEKTEEECRRLRAAAQKGLRPPQHGSGDPEPDAILRSIKEGRYDGESEG